MKQLLCKNSTSSKRSWEKNKLWNKMEAYRYLPAMMHLHTPNQTLSSSAFRWKSCCMDMSSINWINPWGVSPPPGKFSWPGGKVPWNYCLVATGGPVRLLDGFPYAWVHCHQRRERTTSICQWNHRQVGRLSWDSNFAGRPPSWCVKLERARQGLSGSTVIYITLEYHSTRANQKRTECRQ